MKKVLVLIALVLAVLCVAVPPALADNGVRQDGQGKYAPLTALWWQWILEQPAATNPNLDATGADAANGQPLDGVFFLAGSFGGAVTREFTVPAEAALFLPLLNNLGLAPAPAPHPRPDQNQVPQLRTLYAAPLIDDADIGSLHVTLDGTAIGTYERVKSPVFHVTSVDGDLLGAGRFTAVSDGYWLYLPPLSAGRHVLDFGGTSDGFTVQVTDIITVE